MPKYSAVYKQSQQTHGSPIMESMSLDAVKTQCRMFLASKGMDGDCVVVYMVGQNYRANYYYFARDLQGQILEARSTNKEAMKEIRPFTAGAMPHDDKTTVTHRQAMVDAPVTFLGIARELMPSDNDEDVCWAIG